MEETLTLEFDIHKKMDIDVHVYEVIDAINNLDVQKRWNSIARILNQVQLELTGLEENQKEVVKAFLTNKLKLF